MYTYIYWQMFLAGIVCLCMVCTVKKTKLMKIWPDLFIDYLYYRLSVLCTVISKGLL